MSLWDHIKPAAPSPVALSFELGADGRELVLRWNDGQVNHLLARELRQACPCASCVEELTGKKLVAPESVPPGLTMGSVTQVGRYALSFAFGDGHRTGIYDWGLLRALCDAGAPSR